MKQKEEYQEKPLEKISSQSITATSLLASLKTKKIMGVPFHVIDVALMVAFLLGAVVAVTYPFRVFCIIMLAWFALGYFKDKSEYDKLYKRSK